MMSERIAIALERIADALELSAQLQLAELHGESDAAGPQTVMTQAGPVEFPSS